MQKRHHQHSDAAFAFLCSFPYVLLCFLLLQCEHCLYEDGALKALLLNLTAELVGMANVAVKEIGIRMTAAAAVEPRPAVTAQRLVQHM